ncbi:MAG: acyl-CoA dehydrogenase, partial [Syntrophomonadaceae bacterium]|nr:acyl-CoA dehydrogenase [Syntrophomonadaceae bacterium]
EDIQILAKGYSCVEKVKAVYDSWYERFEEKKSLIPLYAVKALFVCAQVQVAQCLLEQALLAQRKLEELPSDHYDYSFYQGKVASAQYYVRQVLPNVFTLTDVIAGGDTTVLNCPEDALVVN